MIICLELGALLTVLHQFLTSRVSTPVPYRPKRMNSFSADDLAALDQLSPKSPNGALSPQAQGTIAPKAVKNFKDNVEAQKVDLEMLENKANGVTDKKEA